MKSVTIKWNVLINGEFPVASVEYSDLAVKIKSLSIAMQEVTITSKTDELITPELAFYIGMLVHSEVSLNKR